MTADECPRISPEWLAAERGRIGDWWFSQEFLCEFNDNISQVFSTADILAAISTDIQPLFFG